MRTFEAQSLLPSLPVAGLQDALGKKLLGTVQPLVTDAEYQRIKELVDDFVKSGGQAEFLRELLCKKAEGSRNWLEAWWDLHAYWAVREPVPINSNFFFLFDEWWLHRTHSQLERAVDIIVGALHFKGILDREELEPEKVKGVLQDMEAYHWVFNTCRIPRRKADTTLKYADSKHIVVIRKGNLYTFDVLSEDGSVLSPSGIKRQLEQVIREADTHATNTPIGAITADNRDHWADVREKILAISANNRAALERIQSGIFVLCLDENEPSTINEMCSALLKGNPKNRWFDKMEFIVFANGAAGLNGEHSKVDGLPIMKLVNHIMSLKYPQSEKNGLQSLRPVTKLSFDLSDDLVHLLEVSDNNFSAFSSSVEILSLHFQKFGKGMITSLKFSPDSFCQMAFQLTHYRMYGRLCGTYESASTKKFFHGRTEVGRGQSMEALDWVKAMDSPDALVKTKQDLLRRACANHSSYMKQAAEGLGCDRLLFGMRLIAQENGIELHPFFSDPSLLLSCHWRLSTSQMGSELAMTGFGPVVEDGYGVCYYIRSDSICFQVSASKRATTTNAAHFLDHLEKSLHHMQILCQATTMSAL